jgi:hemerythrin-like domain-containing protein
VTDLLREQHLEAQELIGRLRDADGDTREAIRAELAKALRGHMQIEEEFLYSRLDDESAIDDLIDDSFAEHEELKDALGDLERADASGDDFEALIDEVEDDVVAHAAEEEAELLPWLESAWSDDMLDDVGAMMKERYDALVTGSSPELML